MSLSTAKALRLILASAVVGILAGSATDAQEAKDAKKPNEKTGEKYQYLEIPEKYDIRQSARIQELNELYKEDYKLLTKEQSEERREANKKTGEAKAERSKALKLVQSVLDGERPVSQYTQALNYWFERIVFAEMTQPDNESLQKLAELRAEFFRDYTQRPRMSKAAHDYVVAKTLNDMKYIAENNFHPAVRYHAMLMIGQLNGEEALPVFSPKSPPVPYRAALPVLIDNYTNDEQIEAVRVAALLGLLRHAELAGSNMAAEDRNRVIDVMLATLDAPPGNRTASGHAWIQRRAVDVLGHLGHVGSGGKVAQRLMKILADEKTPLAMRCSAAVAYGNLDFESGSDPEVAKFAAALGEMVAAECRARLDWLTSEQEQRKRLALTGQGIDSTGTTEGMDEVITTTTEDDSSGLEAGGYGASSPSAFPAVQGDYGAFGDEVDPVKAAMELERHRLRALRRRIKYPVFCAQRALGGELQREGDVEQQENWKLESFLSADEKKFVEQLVQKLNKVQLATDAGREKKEEKGGRDLSREESDEEEVKLPTEAFKDELLAAVREVEQTLDDAPASARLAPPDDETPAGPVGPAGPGPAAPAAKGPAAPAAAAAPEPGLPAAPAGPPAGPAGPPAGP